MFGADATYNIQAQRTADERRRVPPLIVAYRHGAPVRLDQIANVIDSVEDNRNSLLALHEGAAASARSSSTCSRQPGTNTIAITDAIRALFPAFERRAAAVGPPDGARRSLAEHPQGLRRHPGDDGGHARARRRRDLPVPAQRVGDAHSRAGAAVLDPRHVRRR